MKKKKKYIYKVCSLCKKDKEANRTPYCIPCGRSYYKEYRLQKVKQRNEKINVNMVGLGTFIKHLEWKDKFTLIDLDDILNILFFYELVTDNIYEYDQHKGGRQLVLMFDAIKSFHTKNTKK